MIIIVAGIYRSGSTWLYNAVRFLTEEAGYKTQGTFALWERSDEYDCHVIKTHYIYPYRRLRIKKPDFIITSRRDKEDIINSMKAQIEKGLDPQFENAGKYDDINKYFGWLDIWRKRKAHIYEMDFEDLDYKRIKKILHKLNKAMDLDLGYNQICAVEKRLSEMVPPTEGFDHETLLTPTHIK